MIAVPLLLLASLSGGAGAAKGDVSRAAVRSYIATYSMTYLARAHARIPAWARKYNMNCSGCHYPAPPRLNATGQRFKWAGYRMPDEIGEQVNVEKVQNYLAAGGEVDFDYDKVQSTPATNTFSAPAVTVFYAGPFARNFGGFFELENGPDGVERIATIFALWGTEKKGYGGLRFGQMHNFFEWGVAGFDRPVGISAPLPMDEPLTGGNGIPFMLGEHAIGLEGFYVKGSNRLSAQVLNGITPLGEVAPEDVDSKKDFIVTDQFLLDNAGSGVQAMAYAGSVLDTLGTTTSHFWRVAASANKIVNNFEVLGAVALGRDRDLPGGAPDVKALGWWVSGQYVFPKHSFTVFGRFESLDPNTDTPDDADRRVVLGAVLPVTLPEHLRWAVEYRLDTPQGGAPKTNHLATTVQLFF